MTNENKRRTFTEVPGYPGIWVSEDGTAVKGAAHYASKLSDDDVRAIRRRAVEGESQRLLARVFGVAPPTINNIVHRRKWRHVS